MKDVVPHLRKHGADAQVRSVDKPSIPQVSAPLNPDGLAIDLYSEFEPTGHPYSLLGMNPVKLSHVVALSHDPKRTMAFYIDVLPQH